MYKIKYHGLYLYETADLFTVKSDRARVYKTRKGAKDWIKKNWRDYPVSESYQSKHDLEIVNYIPACEFKIDNYEETLLSKLNKIIENQPEESNLVDTKKVVSETLNTPLLFDGKPIGWYEGNNEFFVSIDIETNKDLNLEKLDFYSLGLDKSYGHDDNGNLNKIEIIGINIISKD